MPTLRSDNKAFDVGLAFEGENPTGDYVEAIVSTDNRFSVVNKLNHPHRNILLTMHEFPNFIALKKLGAIWHSYLRTNNDNVVSLWADSIDEVLNATYNWFLERT